MWPIDANQFSAQVASAGDLVVNASSLADKVVIDSADHDTGMRGAITVQSNEVPAVQRQDRTAFADCVIENRIVRHGQARLVGVV